MTDIDVRASEIEGLGLFARRAFRPGDRIAEVHIVREVTPEEPIREDLGERIDHCAYPDGRTVLVAYPERHVNHSCDPNAYEQFEGGTSYLVARRSIAKDDEITVDYNINITNGTAWPCHCGAERCGGRVAGEFFDLPIEWQKEYRPLLAGWFVRRNRARIDALDALDPTPVHRSAFRIMKRDTLVISALVAAAAGWRSTWVLSQLPDGTPAADALRSLLLDPFWLVVIIGGGLARALWR